jgi:hypothetical protein
MTRFDPLARPPAGPFTVPPSTVPLSMVPPSVPSGDSMAGPIGQSGLDANPPGSAGRGSATLGSVTVHCAACGGPR